jgi:hypothetical protein
VDFKQFLIGGFKGGGFKVVDDAVDLILDLAEEVPYNVQQLAHFCWDRLAASEEKQLTAEVVRASLDQLLAREDALYTQLWNQLTGIQQRVLIAVFKERGVEMRSARVTRKYGLSPASVSRALQALQEREILRMDESLGQTKLRLINPFFGAWIEMVGRF